MIFLLVSNKSLSSQLHRRHGKTIYTLYMYSSSLSVLTFRTVFEQHGCIDINGIGPFGRVIEMFAERFLHSGVKRVCIQLYSLINVC